MKTCRRLALASLCILLAGGARGADPAATSAFTGADLFRLALVVDPQIRPDGATVAYVRRSNDLMADRARDSIWQVDVASGVESPLVTGPGSYQSPRWSPDGSRLAYTAVDENGHAQLYVRWTGAGTSARLTDLDEAPASFAWSPDGRSIALLRFVRDEQSRLGAAPARPEGAKWAEPLQFITETYYRSDEEGERHPGHTHLYLVSADGGAARAVTSGPFDERGPLAWTPDGRYVLLSGNRTAAARLDLQNTTVLQVSVASGEVTLLTHRVGADGSPTPSPDGAQIAYLGFPDRASSYDNTRLYVMARDGSHVRSLTDTLDRSIGQVAWAADGKSLVVSYEDHAETRLARVTLDGQLHPLADGPMATDLDRPYQNAPDTAFSLAKDGTIACALAGATRPAELFIYQGGRRRQLTHVNAEALDAKALAEPRPLAVRSSFDGRALDAWLALPPGAAATAKVPLILEIHGGPFSNYGAVFSTDVQLYAAAGYAVLYANPRGSTSYGDQFANLVHHDYPSHDYDDLMSAVDAAIATGRIDPDRLFVTGGSGGGVLTAWIVGTTHRFRAAAVQKPIINWASAALTTDFTPYMTHVWFAKPPWDDPDAYWRHSPLSLVGNVTTPTLVVVGDRDFRSPVSEAEQYYQALQLRGVPTTLIKVPGASHANLAARPSQSAAKASAIIAWFDRYRGQDAP